MSCDQSVESASIAELVRPAMRALRCFWPPFVGFQLLALGIVVGYYRIEAVREACASVSALQIRWGLAFSAAAMVVSGLALPELAKLALRSPFRVRPDQVVSTAIFFALAGVIIDLQYRGLGQLLGNSQSFATVVKKMLADQFILTPLYGVPYWPVVFALRSNRYRLAATLGQFGRRWYYNSVLPLLIPAWCFWIPMTLMIYSLPAELQFGLFALANAAWSLIMLFVAQHTAAATDDQIPAA